MAEVQNPAANAKVDLTRARALLLDDNQVHLNLLSNVLTSFDLRRQTKVNDLRDAKAAASGAEFDLVLVEAALARGTGFEFIRWLRREGPDFNRTTSVLVVTSGTRMDQVAQARDAGANFVVAKPVTPPVLLQRIIWLGRDKRLFVEAEKYCGPDRRFKAFGPPVGTKGRRHDDLNFKLGAAAEPNMSQNEIDLLIKPQRVNL
ncbi:MAG TPA: response regulator [Caulobacter sp.]|nr:response regulator [Caulobacter sp.]